MRDNAKSRAHRGFSLIELLVVITIVTILLALLMPSLSEARRTAKEAACLANTRSLGQSGAQYAVDFNRYTTPQVIYPTNFNYTPSLSEGRVMETYRWAYWADCLALYLQGEQVFDCPTGSYRILGTTQVKSKWGYAQNPFVYPVDANGARTSVQLRRVDDFRNPFEKLWYMDSGYSAMSNQAGVSPREYFSPFFAADFASSSDNRSTPAIRHGTSVIPALVDGQMPTFPGGFNSVYYDGHASYVEWRLVIPRYFGGGSSTAEDRAKRNQYWLP